MPPRGGSRGRSPQAARAAATGSMSNGVSAVWNFGFSRRKINFWESFLSFFAGDAARTSTVMKGEPNDEVGREG